MARNPLELTVESLKSIVNAQATRDSSDRDLLKAFCSQNDQAAFAALVKRHGPMVFALCKRVVRHQQDAEDAFQAVFIVLARNAATVGKCGSLAGWLHRVAYRTGLRILRAAARRSRHEEKANVMSPSSPARDAAWHELQTLLDSEIQRLPAKYREPFILCCLENLGSAEAGKRLGLKEGTIWTRIAEARKRLRARLQRHGVALSTVLAAVALGPTQTQAGLPVGLMSATVSTALACREGAMSANIISERVAALVRAANSSLLLSSARLGVSLLLGLSALLGVAGWAASRHDAPQSGDGLPLAQVLAKEQEKPPKPRVDRQGDPLPEHALARLGSLRFRHGYLLRSVVFGPEDRTLFSAGSDGIIRIWDVSSGSEVGRLVGHKGAVNKLAISRDKMLLASAGHDGTVRIWDVRGRKEIKQLQANDGPVASVALADGGTLASASGQSVKLWDIKSGLERSRMALAEGVHERAPAPPLRGATALALTPDGTMVACSDKGGLVKLWDAQSGTLIRTIPSGPTFVMAHDGKTLFTQIEGELVAWDVRTGQKRFELEEVKQNLDPEPGHSRGWGAWTTLAVSPDGKTLAAVTYKKSDSLMSTQFVRIWDLDARKLKTTLGWTQNSPDALAFTGDGARLAIAPQGGTIQIWDLAAGKPSLDDGHRELVNHLFFTSDGKEIVSGSLDGTCRLWDAESGIERRRITQNDGFRATSLSPDNRTLVVGIYATRLPLIYVWDMKTGLERGRFRPSSDQADGRRRYLGASSVAFAPDGSTFVVLTNDDNRIHFWDAANLKELRNFQPEKRVERIGFSPDGKILAASGKGFIYFWESASGRAIKQWQGHDQWPAFAFSPDGRLVASADGETVRLWDFASGLERWRLPMASQDPIFITFSPDGRWLVTGGKPVREVHLLETATGKEVLTLRGHERAVTAAAFSPDGRRLATASEDTTVLVWDLVGLR